MKNLKKIKNNTKGNPKKQKVTMINISDQNSDDEEIDVCTHLLLMLYY